MSNVPGINGMPRTNPGDGPSSANLSAEDRKLLSDFRSFMSQMLELLTLLERSAAVLKDAKASTMIHKYREQLKAADATLAAAMSSGLSSLITSAVCLGISTVGVGMTLVGTIGKKVQSLPPVSSLISSVTQAAKNLFSQVFSRTDQSRHAVAQPGFSRQSSSVGSLSTTGFSRQSSSVGSLSTSDNAGQQPSAVAASSPTVGATAALEPSAITPDSLIATGKKISEYGFVLSMLGPQMGQGIGQVVSAGHQHEAEVLNAAKDIYDELMQMLNSSENALHSAAQAAYSGISQN